MSATFATVEELLTGGDIEGAAEEFGKLRPGHKSTLEGLKLSARIHAAAGNWEKVGVLSSVLRGEFPSEVAGFEFGAQSLYKRGRQAEAVALLQTWNGPASGRDAIDAALDRYKKSTEAPA